MDVRATLPMTPTLDLLDLDVCYAYTHAVRLLSLDRVTPFWPDLGLRIDDVLGTTRRAEAGAGLDSGGASGRLSGARRRGHWPGRARPSRST